MVSRILCQVKLLKHVECQLTFVFVNIFTSAIFGNTLQTLPVLPGFEAGFSSCRKPIWLKLFHAGGTRLAKAPGHAEVIYSPMAVTACMHHHQDPSVRSSSVSMSSSDESDSPGSECGPNGIATGGSRIALGLSKNMNSRAQVMGVWNQSRLSARN